MSNPAEYLEAKPDNNSTKNLERSTDVEKLSET